LRDSWQKLVSDFLVSAREQHHSGDEHEREYNDPNASDPDLDAHHDLLKAAASDRIEGTQIPTNRPASLSTKNQRKTEKRNEMKAARSSRFSGRSFLFMILPAVAAVL
jgi:hypothetical protein